MINVLAVDELDRTPRNLCLINSPMYKILYHEEKKLALNNGDFKIDALGINY